MDYYDQINANVLSATFRQNAQINLKINTSRENFVRPEALEQKLIIQILTIRML